MLGLSHHTSDLSAVSQGPRKAEIPTLAALAQIFLVFSQDKVSLPPAVVAGVALVGSWCRSWLSGSDGRSPLSPYLC